MGGRARASSGGLRLVLLAFLAAGLLLIPAAQASAEDFSLTINVVGEGTVECEVNFLPAEPCEDEYPEETEISLVAEPEIEWKFVGFSGAGCALECTLFMDNDYTITATFEAIPIEEFELKIEMPGSGEGTVLCAAEEGPEECQSTYPDEKELRLEPKPDLGSEFVGWSGDCSTEPCDLVMDEDHTVAATFKLVNPASLTVNFGGAGSGSVKCKVGAKPAGPCAPEYGKGAKVELVASAGSGSEFAGWSGDCTGSGSCVLTMDGVAKSVTATFNLKPTSDGDGLGSGGSGGDTGTKPRTPPPGKLGVSGAALFQGGKAVLRLSCKGQGACKGSLKLVAKLKIGKAGAKNVEIGKASFSLAAGASTTLKVKLAGAAKKVLGKAKTVKATVSGAGVTKSTLTIKPTAR